MRVLITRSWTIFVLVIGLFTLKKWGIVSSSFPEPPPTHDEVLEIASKQTAGTEQGPNVDSGQSEGTEQEPKITGEKFEMPTIRLYREPDYSNKDEVAALC